MKTLYEQAIEDNLITDKDIKDNLLNSKKFLDNLVHKAIQYNYDFSEANLLRCLKKDLDYEFRKIETVEEKKSAFERLKTSASPLSSSCISIQHAYQNFKSDNHGNDDIYTLINSDRIFYCGIWDLKIYALSRHTPSFND